MDTPRSLAYDSNTNTLYVSDSANHRILSYTNGSLVGTVLISGDGRCNTTSLNTPREIYYDSSTNSLVISNYGCHNIVRWVIGASRWTLVAGNLNGVSGAGSTALNGPWDFTFDRLGNLYVADRYNHRIQFFLANQMNATTIAGVTSSLGSNETLLNEPIAVSLDSQLNLYVADLYNDRIQQFLRIL